MYSKAIVEYEDEAISLEEELKTCTYLSYKIEDELEETNDKIYQLKDSINDVVNGKNVIYFKEGF